MAAKQAPRWQGRFPSRRANPVPRGVQGQESHICSRRFLFTRKSSPLPLFSEATNCQLLLRLCQRCSRTQPTTSRGSPRMMDQKPPSPTDCDHVPSLSPATYSDSIDVHCHPTDTPDSLNVIPTLRTQRLLVMGTREEDWPLVAGAAEKWPEKVIPCFGLHPWFAHHCPAPPSASEGSTHPPWLQTLTVQLESHPTALVGEIGIDGIAKDRTTDARYPFEHQLVIFRAQLQLAARMRRSVSMHTVRCHGHLVDVLREMLASGGGDGAEDDPLPPRLKHHSYSGSTETTRALLSLRSPHRGRKRASLPTPGSRMYFSFSAGVNGRSPKAMERIRAVPDDRVLLESDTHDARIVDAAMEDACRLVAAAKGWTIEETAETTGRNARRFLGEEG
ncbi:uncharacterized protein EV422DRAFT_529768 [Fimicolochytrium jonesii]|uniref:uncharacterized protein n=1 Tax=Fimicolochytrium jonesii TaxID=1396493 RepID=UPI0022FF076E|nr:uncharacterized protein EV422DRAFT_529768 [Fimicolochytrium jonesii]KAI8820690.1 hypothetical protein EV422DRAFT_529768 [Fimicolochytrium jonesii]